MKHIRRLTMAVALAILVVQVGILTAILKSISIALEQIVDAEVGVLNWFFVEKDESPVVGGFSGITGGDDDEDIE